jgi:hypothetical protein
VTEAIPIADLDESALRAGHADSLKAFSDAVDGSIAKATAQIELETFASIARVIGVTL